MHYQMIYVHNYDSLGGKPVLINKYSCTSRCLMQITILFTLWCTNIYSLLKNMFMTGSV